MTKEWNVYTIKSTKQLYFNKVYSLTISLKNSNFCFEDQDLKNLGYLSRWNCLN